MTHLDGAILSASDQHYQHVGIARLLQNAANDYTEVRLDGSSTATNSGVATHRNDIEPEFSPNAFGKSNHGVACWDVKRFIFRPSRNVVLEAAVINNLQYGITDDGQTRTTPVLPDEDGWVEGADFEATSLTGAAGEITQVADKVKRYDQPFDMSDGQNTFHNLLTKSQYRLYIGGAGNPAVLTIMLGMLARRVLVPLTEVFFDRETIEGLLDAVILESILN